jgi:hypothetical protein
VIVVSLVLFLAGVALLAAGLVSENISLELGSIAAALLAAMVLYFGVRQRGGPETEEADSPAPPQNFTPLTATRSRPDDAEPTTAPAQESDWLLEPAGEPIASGPSGQDQHQDAYRQDPYHQEEYQQDPYHQDSHHQDGDHQEQDPVLAAAEPLDPVEPLDRIEPHEPLSILDEPDEEYVSDADALRVADRSDDVLVIDGRPRYHLELCPSLGEDETVPLPVSEAREAGFTPCARCRPDSHILGDAWRSGSAR